MHTEISPPGLAPPAANYAHAVLVEQPQRWLYTAGVVPVSPTGAVPAGVADQAALVWSNIAAMLDAADMGADDVVSVTTYVVVGHSTADVMAARDEALGGRRVASTLLPVPALARPEWLVEIAVVAAR